MKSSNEFTLNNAGNYLQGSFMTPEHINLIYPNDIMLTQDYHMIYGAEEEHQNNF